MRTSDSDIPSYRDIIRLALTDENAFNNFKRQPEYRQILEHLTYEQGISYLDVILRNTPLLMETNYENFIKNDTYGNPITFFYDKIGNVSPSTIRYVKILSDLIKMNYDLNDKTIIEIGGGYGGQCLIISQYFRFKEYIIVDLIEPLMLTKKYLELNNVINVNFKQTYELDDTLKYDFVISNYALTECTNEVQKIYNDKIIKNSQHGYITGSFDDKNEIFTSIKNFHIFNETPLTGINNRNLMW